MEDLLSVVLTFVIFWVAIEVFPLAARKAVSSSLERKRYFRSLNMTRLFVMTETEETIVKKLKETISDARLEEMGKDELTEIICSMPLIPGIGNFEYIRFIDEAKRRNDIELMHMIARKVPSKAWKSKILSQIDGMRTP